jgi:hypothetical protein
VSAEKFPQSAECWCSRHRRMLVVGLGDTELGQGWPRSLSGSCQPRTVRHRTTTLPRRAIRSSEHPHTVATAPSRLSSHTAPETRSPISTARSPRYKRPRDSLETAETTHRQHDPSVCGRDTPGRRTILVASNSAGRIVPALQLLDDLRLLDCQTHRAQLSSAAPGHAASAHATSHVAS